MAYNSNHAHEYVPGKSVDVCSCGYFRHREPVNAIVEVKAPEFTIERIAKSSKAPKKRYIETVWRVSTYDVWGNASCGYQVNDVYRAGTVAIKLLVETANAGTNAEFEHASPSDKQLREAFGLNRLQLDTDGDDTIIYVNRSRDSYPIGELECTSHESLSPIRKDPKVQP